MKHDWTADLLTYWDSLRGTRAAPDRRDVSPRDLGSKLPNIFILRSDTDSSDGYSADTASIPAAKQWQFRLAGTRLCTLYGRELRNTRFLSLWHEDVRPWLAEQLHLSGLDYRPLRLEHTGVTLSEKSCHFETLLLPLHETDGSPAWIGSMVALEQPLWLGSDPLISNQMGLSTQTAHILSQEISSPSIPITPGLVNSGPVSSGPVRSGPVSSGMKSVLQVLLDRHHELAPAKADTTALSSTNVTNTQSQQKAENENLRIADTAFARAVLPQIEALMPSALVADQITRNPAQTAPAPLTVADLIKSIHPVAAQQESTHGLQKNAHLKLITGGKDKSKK